MTEKTPEGYLTDEERKMPEDMRLLQIVLGISECKTKGEVVDLLKSEFVEKEKVREAKRELCDRFGNITRGLSNSDYVLAMTIIDEIFEKLGLDAQTPQKCNKTESSKGKVATPSDAFPAEKTSEGETALKVQKSPSDVCKKCGKTKEEHLSGWGHIHRYCSYDRPLQKFEEEKKSPRDEECEKIFIEKMKGIVDGFIFEEGEEKGK